MTKRTEGLALFAPALVLMFLVSGGYPLMAQASEPSKSFDVASVRPIAARDEKAFSLSSNPSGIIYKQVTLGDCIQAAYDMKDIQISGPDWMRRDRLDIMARTSNANSNELKLMLQSLLADRFKLSVHHETKPMDAVTIGVGKGQMKVKESAVEGPGVVKRIGNSSIIGAEFQHMSMDEFITYVTRRHFFDGPVVDKTGLKGRYDFTLVFIDLADEPNETRHELNVGDPGYATALTRVGFRVDVKKTPTDVLKVDHAEKPEAN